MVIVFYIVSVLYALFTGYITGQDLDREAEIVGGLFLGETALVVLMAITSIDALHIIIMFVVWMAVSLSVSELVRKFFKY